MMMAKKDLRQALEAYEDENPAQAFLSPPVDTKPANKSPRQSKVKAKPIKKERYDRRVYMLMKPSIHDAVTERAKAQGMSFNAYINSLVEDHLKDGE